MKKGNNLSVGEQRMRVKFNVPPVNIEDSINVEVARLINWLENSKGTFGDPLLITMAQLQFENAARCAIEAIKTEYRATPRFTPEDF